MPLFSNSLSVFISAYDFVIFYELIFSLSSLNPIHTLNYLRERHDTWQLQQEYFPQPPLSVGHIFHDSTPAAAHILHDVPLLSQVWLNEVGVSWLLVPPPLLSRC